MSEEKRGKMSIWEKMRWIAVTLLALYLLAFIIANDSHDATVNFLITETQKSVAIIVLVSALLGALVAMGVSLRLVLFGRRKRKQDS